MNPLEALARFPLFALMGRDWLGQWLGDAEEQPFALGETLYQSGVWLRWLFVVLEGRVRILLPAEVDRETAVGVFRPGDIFGEYALLAPGSLPATCRAGARGRVLRLKLRDLRLAVAEKPELHASIRAWLRLHALLRFLREGSCLGFMSAPSFLPLQERTRRVSIPAGQVAQVEGLSDSCWFFIEEGQVLLSSLDGRPGQTLGPGDCFGERALAGWGDLPLATAQTGLTCLTLDREAFLAPLGAEDHHGQQSLAATPRPRQTSRPFVAQREASDCGVACLTMAAQAYGRSLRWEQVRALLPLGHRGANMAELQQAAALLGFRTRPVDLSIARLADATLPAIALLGSEHYVVVYTVANDEIIVGDPARGVVTLRQAEFQKRWTGSLLLLSPHFPAAGEQSVSWLLPSP